MTILENDLYVAHAKIKQQAARIAELAEENAILKSQMENADVNLEQVRLNTKARITELEAIAKQMAAALEAGNQWFLEYEEYNTDKHTKYTSGPMREALSAFNALP